MTPRPLHLPKGKPTIQMPLDQYTEIVDGLTYDLNKAMTRLEQLETELADAQGCIMFCAEEGHFHYAHGKQS